MLTLEKLKKMIKKLNINEKEFVVDQSPNFNNYLRIRPKEELHFKKSTRVKLEKMVKSKKLAAFNCTSCFHIQKVFAIFLLSLFLLPGKAFSCSRDTTLLKEELQQKLNVMEEKANEQTIEYIVICGYRSQQEQNRLYAQGRTSPGKKVTWVKNSKHTTKTAVDIAIIKNGTVSWRGEDYYALGEIGKEIGLVWGGDWKVKDYGHFQLAEE